MGTVLIHAGMPKTGSTSIQTWIRNNGVRLRDAHGISNVHTVETGPGSRTLEVTTTRNAHEIVFLLLYHESRQRGAGADELRVLTRGFATALDTAASEHGTVLMTAEGFAVLFIAGDEPFLAALERLAQRHTVRIAYYVRPQHTTLEARWRQWGYRSELSPSEWVLDQAHQLRYADTADLVAGIAPHIDFDVRPFRPDLLVGGDVVADFARGFLGLDDAPPAPGVHENPGLSLDFANLLRGAPAALLDDPGTRMNSGARQLALGMLGRSWGLAESQEARESRAVLQGYAYEEFEPRNRVLAAARKWPTPSFVPPPDDARSQVRSLTDLDALWQPPQSASARAYLYAALSELMSR
jgi:hypothetical protein